MTRKHLHDLIKRVLRLKSRRGVAKAIREAIATHKLSTKRRGTWGWYLARFANQFENGKVPHVIFTTSGNTKLPFASFSVLPQYTCPGAGACLAWCYSFRAWRYPGGFCRQLQNTWLLRYERETIASAWLKLRQNIIVRLYVDGDIESADVWGFWVKMLGWRPDIRAYGYSKSWQILANWQGAWPVNYVLNVSEGSRYDTDSVLREQISALPITRGIFGAVELSLKHAKGFKRYASATYHKDVRESARATHGKVFSCPGKCGSCCGGNHACGNIDFHMPIMIGVH